ncbi:MAG: thioredoxin [Methanosaeta sp. PtaB.Bin018]|nr:MAG: thioredoxin [Methanosaeta sp. PtaB.Bin018]OPY47825.1 MAG: thioredoxin [Methanosaeta sp. PtaU1.Bin016]
MDDLDEIRKKKMERMMKEMNRPPAPSVQLPDKPVIVTDETLDSAARQYPVFILDCWAEWCGPCRMLGPIIEELARELKGKVVFGKLNVDQNMQTANEHRISAIPTLLVFKNGKLVDKLVGAYPKGTLAAKIQKYL